ncbi:hypothetical protein [Streptomyces mirabilis]
MTLSEEARQSLADGARPEAPTAATEVRDQVLRAIGREAEHVAATQPGQASKALAELAHSYALVTSPVLTAGLVANTEGVDAGNGSARAILYLHGGAYLFPMK